MLWVLYQGLHGAVVTEEPKAGPLKEDQWRKYLILDSRGRLTPALGNVALILTHADGFRGCLKLKDGHIEWARTPNYEVGVFRPEGGDRFGEEDLAYLQHVLLALFGLRVHSKLTRLAVKSAAYNELRS